MGNLYMRKQIAPYAMPLVYLMIGFILVIGLIKISVEVLARESWGYLWR
jgi:hypothetical protein